MGKKDEPTDISKIHEDDKLLDNAKSLEDLVKKLEQENG